MLDDSNGCTRKVYEIVHSDTLFSLARKIAALHAPGDNAAEHELRHFVSCYIEDQLSGRDKTELESEILETLLDDTDWVTVQESLLDEFA